jgi:hypothetical protein
MIPLKKPEMQGGEISSKLKARRAIEINPFQLLASGFQLLCNAADWVFSAESGMIFNNTIFLTRQVQWLRVNRITPLGSIYNQTLYLAYPNYLKKQIKRGMPTMLTGLSWKWNSNESPYSNILIFLGIFIAFLALRLIVWKNTVLLEDTDSLFYLNNIKTFLTFNIKEILDLSPDSTPFYPFFGALFSLPGWSVETGARRLTPSFFK